MKRFYELHEEIKKLQKVVQNVVFDELNIKVNIIIETKDEEHKLE